MKSRLCKYVFVALTFVLLHLQMKAQVNVRTTVSRDKILIGEPIAVTVEAYIPLGTDFNWFRADSIPAFEITQQLAIDTAENMDGKKISQTLIVTSFDSGMQYVPPFEILVNRQAFYTDSIPVQVSYTPFDPNADYRDIKDIIEIENPLLRYIPWVLAAAALLSLIGLVIILSRKKSGKEKALAPVVPALLPYDEAMKALRELKQRGITGGVKEFYSELNDILRRYLSREFAISTFERTNEELIMQLPRLNVSREMYLALAQSLRMTDFVKFAKYVPEEAENNKSFDIVMSSIETLNKRLSSAV